jgi:Leucine-rich repeat (LRR) protein
VEKLAILRKSTNLVKNQKGTNMQSPQNDDELAAYVLVNPTAPGLDLSYRKVTDVGLEHLKRLVKLKLLFLSGTPVTDAGLEHLNGLVQLKWLYLEGTPVTDGGLEHLKGLRELEELDLRNTQVTDAGIAALKRSLPTLRVYSR